MKKSHPIFSDQQTGKLRVNREQAYCKLRAQAKINLSLKILGKRPDNYHQLHSIMQSLALHDIIKLTLKPLNPTAETNISLFSNNGDLSCGMENIAYRSAKLFLEHFQLKADLTISIIKNISLAAGLAGGSANGAAVLRGLADLYNNPQSRLFFRSISSANRNNSLNSSKISNSSSFSNGSNTIDADESLQAANKRQHKIISQTALLEIAVKIGADVPFCLQRGTALCEGIGEIINPLDSFSGRPVLIYNPPETILTAEAFQALNAQSLAELKLADQKSLDHYNRLLRTGLKAMHEHFANDFTSAILYKYPHLQNVCHTLKQTGSQFVRFTGSGPTIFAVYDSYTERDQALLLLEKSDFPGTFTATYTKDAWD
ncbi:MAG: 4-(cytidine 5'-diphospho)-2-C-methyl-D-erythritol kinase [Saccharofermentanales bacterium]